jgi:hypothetical protein
VEPQPARQQRTRQQPQARGLTLATKVLPLIILMAMITRGTAMIMKTTATPARMGMTMTVTTLTVMPMATNMMRRLGQGQSDLQPAIVLLQRYQGRPILLPF